MGLTLLKKPLASRSWLRRNSNALPWSWLVPDLETKVMVPPEAWPDSALKPLPSTLNSVRASTDGENLVAASDWSAPFLPPAMDEPSSATPKALFPPPMWYVPLPLPTSGVDSAMSKGLREAPFTKTGSESTRNADTVVDTLPFSVCTICAAALTSTLCDTAPTSSATSTPADPPGVTATL